MFSSKFAKRLVAGVLAGCMLFTLAACNKTKDSSNKGGSVVVGITQEPGTFDPHTVVAAGDREIIFNIYDGLYKFSSDGSLNPALATGCDISSDCKEFTFTIRENVKFHNDKDLTVDDVVYSINRMIENDASYAATISSVDKVSDSQVKVTLNESDSEFLAKMNFGIIPADVADIAKTPIGTGPFKFKEYLVGQSVTLVKNENYWKDESLPYLDEVVFKICPDMDAGLLELQNHSIDIFPHMTKDKADMVGSGFDILSAPSNMVQIFALNNAVAPFDDIRVREAMNLALDRDELINLSMDGAGMPLVTAMSPAMGEAYDSSLVPYTYDEAAAKALLAEAGYENGFDMTITVPGNYLVHVNTAIAIADQLKKVGINATIEEVDWNKWLEDTYTGRNYQSTVICLTSDYAPMDVIDRYQSEASGNFINFANDEVDEIINKIPLTLDDNERMELYHELLGILRDNHISCYIQDPMEITVVNSELEGYEMYPMYIQDMSTVKYK